MVRVRAGKKRAVLLAAAAGLAVFYLLFVGAVRENFGLWDEKEFELETADDYRISAVTYEPRMFSRKTGVIIAHGASEYGKELVLYKKLSASFAAERFPVLKFDFRGFGKSEKPRKLDDSASFDWNEDLNAAIKEAYRRFKIDNLYLVGHSFGCGPSLAAAHASPDVVSGVVKIGPPRRMRDLFFAEGPERGVEWLLERMRSDMRLEGEIPPGILNEIFLPIMMESFWDEEFLVPVYIIEEGRSSVRDNPEVKKKEREFVEEFVKAVKGPVRSIYLEGADHYFGTQRAHLNDDIYSELAEVLLGILNEQTPRSDGVIEYVRSFLRDAGKTR